jgi:ABC-2 type transport system permease protein
MTDAAKGSPGRRIWAMVYRHLCLYRGSWPRALELMYWPVLQMLIWGFVTEYAGRFQGAFAIAAGSLIGAVLLWETALRSQMGFTISFLEELWSRNLGNLFVSPIRPWELVASLIVMSIARAAIGVGTAALLAGALYAFDITSLGLALVPFLLNLMVFGWAIALMVTAMILRHGAGAESLAWSVLFGLAPLSAVFYPVSVLPGWLQPVALALPTTHVFEGMRAAITEGPFPTGHLAWAFALNAVLMALAVWLFIAVFRIARRRGLLLTVGE